MKATITVTQTGTLTQANDILNTYGNTKGDGMITLEAKGQAAQTILNHPGAKLVCHGKARFTQGNMTLAVQQVEVITLPKGSSVPMPNAEVSGELEEANQQIKVLEAELERCFQEMLATNTAEDAEKLSKIEDALANFNKKLTKPVLVTIIQEIQQVLNKELYPTEDAKKLSKIEYAVVNFNIKQALKK